MRSSTCAGLLVTGTGTGTGPDGAAREVYLDHVVDDAWSMAEHGAQCVVWQTVVNPVVALELLATGVWSGSGVLGACPSRVTCHERECSSITSSTPSAHRSARTVIPGTTS